MWWVLLLGLGQVIDYSALEFLNTEKRDRRYVPKHRQQEPYTNKPRSHGATVWLACISDDSFTEDMRFAVEK